MFTKIVDYYMKFPKFLSLLQKRGLSYAISRISISSPKNVDYHMRILEFLSLLQKRVKVLVYCLIGIHAWLKHRSSCMSYSVLLHILKRTKQVLKQDVPSNVMTLTMTSRLQN